jgi:copper chaperone CopZ
MTTITFSVPDMSCQHCVNRITKTLEVADNTAKIEADVSSKRVAVTSSLSQETIVKLLDDVGFNASIIEPL